MCDYQSLVKDKISDNKSKEEVAKAIVFQMTYLTNFTVFMMKLFRLWNRQHAALLPEVDDYTADLVDAYLHVEDILSNGGIMSKGKVIKRTKDSEMKPVGLRNADPFF